jgi:hypothetical protein
MVLMSMPTVNLNSLGLMRYLDPLAFLGLTGGSEVEYGAEIYVTNKLLNKPNP